MGSLDREERTDEMCRQIPCQPLNQKTSVYRRYMPSFEVDRQELPDEPLRLTFKIALGHVGFRIGRNLELALELMPVGLLDELSNFPVRQLPTGRIAQRVVLLDVVHER